MSKRKVKPGRGNDWTRQDGVLELKLPYFGALLVEKRKPRVYEIRVLDCAVMMETSDEGVAQLRAIALLREMIVEAEHTMGMSERKIAAKIFQCA